MVGNTVEYDELCGVSATNDVDESTPQTRRKKTRSKSVHFADSKGLALTSIFLFARPKDNLSPPRTRRTLERLKDIRRADSGNSAKLNFISPVSHTEVLERLQTQNVCLENIVCHTFGIYGRIHVKNIAFVKEVSVRFTFDAWQTFRDQPANYIPGASTKERDLFFFQIKPPQISENTTKMRFAICYRVCDMEFWDNNHGDDYRVVSYKTKDTMDLSLI